MPNLDELLADSPCRVCKHLVKFQAIARDQRGAPIIGGKVGGATCPKLPIPGIIPDLRICTGFEEIKVPNLLP
jgi:hypothetical protein